MPDLDKSGIAETSGDEAEEHDGPAKSEAKSRSEYQRPLLVALGPVRRATKGSAASGRADANSQYYW
jgi:hypothetical protein